jgi:K+-transporting ATPase KdpF subunit
MHHQHWMRKKILSIISPGCAPVAYANGIVHNAKSMRRFGAFFGSFCHLCEVAMLFELCVGGVMAFGLAIYLAYALIHPEKF